MMTILVVDNDVAFAFWLGYGLTEAGYAAFPAESVCGAKALLDEVRISVDLLIIDTTLPGAAGFVESLRSLNPNLKVMTFLEQPEQDQIPHADVRCRKPSGTGESTRQTLIAQIKRILPPFVI